VEKYFLLLALKFLPFFMQFSLQTSITSFLLFLPKVEVYFIFLHRSHLTFLIIRLSFLCLKCTLNFN